MAKKTINAQKDQKDKNVITNIIDVIQSSKSPIFNNSDDNIIAIIKQCSKLKKREISQAIENIKFIIDYLNILYDQIINSSYIHNIIQLNKLDILNIQNIIELIKSSVNIIDVLNKSINVKNFLLLKIKMNLLISFIKYLTNKISQLVTDITMIKIDEKKLQNINVIVQNIKNILTSLNDINVKYSLVRLFKKSHLEIIFLGLNKIVTIISDINSRKLTTALNRMTYIKLIISSLVSIISSLLLMLPLMLLFILASPLIMLCFWLIAKVFEFIVKLFKPKQLFNMSIGILIIGIIVTSLLILTAMFLTIGLMAEQLNPKWGSIVVCLFGILAVITIMGIIAIAIGMLVVKLTMATSGIGPAIILVGLYTMALIVSAFLIIAIELRILQEIKLDSAKIINNTKTIIKTAFEVIKAIFESTYEIGGAQKSDSWFSKILGFMGGVVATMMTAILSVRFLALTMISVGLMLIMAVELRILQTLDLKKDKILENVNTVISTALEVIKAIFENTYEIGGAQKSDSWFSKILKFMGGVVSTILIAILSVRFLALTIVSIGLILIMAVELRILQTLDLKKDKILENVNTVISTALEVIRAIFEPKNEEKDTPVDKSWFVKVLEYVGGTIFNLISAILSIRFLALTLVSISLICLMAKQLEYISKLELNKDLIKEKIEAVLNVANMVIQSIFYTSDSVNETPTKKNWLKSSLEFLLATNPLLKLIGAFTSIAFLGLIFFSIYILKEIAQNLSIIEKINFNEANIINGVENILSTAKMVYDKIIAYDFKGFNFDILEGKKQKFEILNNFINIIASSVEDMVKNINSINKINDTQRINTTIDDLNNILNNIISKFNINEKLLTGKINSLCKLQNLIEKINSLEIYSSQSKISKEILENYSNFITKIENTSLDKLKTTTNLFEKMAEFSKTINGNFEDLADVLNEKIAPLLEELKELMDGVGKKVEKSGADTSASIFAANNPNLSVNEMRQQVNREIPNNEENQKEQLLQQRMSQQAQQQTNSLISKLDELITLFKSGQYSEARL